MKNLTAEKTEELMELATCIAYEAFEDPAQEHVTGLFERLVYGYWHGEGISSASTLH
ncbi:MAG: hypothetical protein PHN76_05935 [Advenella sp.]|uniref:hypothetical protein n=1 Tax=Advenella sp. TaxID=1872388 RepID=UPI00258D3922|nr:hypothetical protein [Advenella sp.]MDD3757686.1 hypothetical protein [Advenella sp.]